MHDIREQQLQAELDADAAAQAKRLQELIKASESGDLETPRARVIIGQMMKVVMQELETTAKTVTRGVGGKYKSWLRALPLDVAAVIAVRECIRMCTSPETHVHVQDLADNVGKLWELEVRIRQAEAVNPLYMQKVHNNIEEHGTTSTNHIRRVYANAIAAVFKGSLDLGLTRAEMTQIGKYGVDACVQAGLLQVVRGTNKVGTTVTYVLSPEVEQFLKGYSHNDVRNIISKEETRMLCPPDDWSNLTDGGYLSIRRKMQAPLMNVRKLRKSVRNEVASAFTAERMPQVFRCANYLQSIPFSVHAPTRAAILRLWDAGGGVLGVPDRKGPQKPKFPYAETWSKDSAPPEEVAVFQRWKRSTAAYYDDVREWRGKIREVASFIRSTNEADGPFWLPVYFDSRGRWYYRGTPNPQGSDLAKGVLHLHKKLPLGKDGAFWLKVQIANSYGYDKVRMHERAEWVDQNWRSFEAALDSPEDKPEVWGDSPWCTFAAAWELREAYRSGNPETYCTGIAVHQDATCSGLQHFSALLRDEVGGLYVNLRDPHKVGPKQDIYTRVAEAALRMIRLDLESEDEELRARAAWCLDVGIPRSLAKKPVMTYVYGATLRGTAEHVETVLEKEVFPATGKNWRDQVRSFDDAMYIAKKLFAGIAAAVPAAAAAMRWLKSIASQMPNGRRMSWHTPVGFWVQHDYQDYNEQKVRLNSCGVVQVLVRDWNDGTRAPAMRNAISPNFVHALDASHLTLTANAMAEAGCQMVAIHDSFGTHPCHVSIMRARIREQFVALYSRPNIMADFLWEVGGVGEVPSKGHLDLREVLDSEFMFC